jgi:hypothetical protein
MNPWECKQYKNIYRNTINEGGISIYFGKSPSDLKKAIDKFITWLETNYDFPVKIYIDFVYKNYLKMRSGRKVNGKFCWLDTHDDVEIIIPIKEYPKKRDLEDIMGSLAHELTHYMEWINNIDQSEDETDKYCFILWDQFFKSTTK